MNKIPGQKLRNYVEEYNQLRTTKIQQIEVNNFQIYIRRSEIKLIKENIETLSTQLKERSITVPEYKANSPKPLFDPNILPPSHELLNHPDIQKYHEDPSNGHMVEHKPENEKLEDLEAKRAATFKELKREEHKSRELIKFLVTLLKLAKANNLDGIQKIEARCKDILPKTYSPTISDEYTAPLTQPTTSSNSNFKIAAIGILFLALITAYLKLSA